MSSRTKFCLWSKTLLLLMFCALNIYLFVLSLEHNYQYEFAKEQIMFREEMPTMDSWINSPFGKLKSYLYNVTNAAAFLNGTDPRMKIEQVGPIVYNIRGFIEVLNRNETSITYKKYRYRHVEFSPEESVSPDIMNQTITMPNSVLLGSTSKINEWNAYVRLAFNALTMTEKPFLTNTVHYFLWEFTTPGLQMISDVIPFISSNCGVLYNALSEKEEVYTVNIGQKPGMENFFRIQTLNGRHVLKQQKDRLKNLKLDNIDDCPIDAHGTFDNSLFPPFIKKDTKLDIIAIESCRSLTMNYQREQEVDGLMGYRYSLLPKGKTPNCLNSTYGIQLPQGMFDASKCIIHNAPTAFSGPQFYGSAYNWSEHFEGLNPNADDHDPYIVLEPTTGIPLTERYRFQSNIPMPDLTGFSKKLSRFSNIIIPVFWYEFEMDELPGLAKFLIRMNVQVMPVLQPVLMSLFVILAAWSGLLAILMTCGISCMGGCRNLCAGGSSNTLLATTFPVNERRDVTHLSIDGIDGKQ